MYSLLNRNFLRKFFSGKIIELKKNQDLKETIEKEANNSKILIDFYADWCGPCKNVKPVLDDISKTTDIDIIKINVDNHETLSSQFNVSSIPYFLFLKDKDLKATHNGMINKEDVIKKFE